MLKLYSMVKNGKFLDLKKDDSINEVVQKV
ncbi:hypothetical protein H4V97_000042 [Flavobacterium sp. CG_23.5]|nr:hypothetical protein [Flavobacterium sp. CG_23.5]